MPVQKMLEKVRREMYIPNFRKNKPGMQPGDPLLPDDQLVAEAVWIQAADACMRASEELARLEVHKQWANRPLEWFGHIRAVVSSTDWKNFFALREDVDEHMRPIAQDEIYDLSQEMQRKLSESEPQHLEPGQWHLPYVPWNQLIRYSEDDWSDMIKRSVACCARASYDNLDGTASEWARDLQLYDKLLGSSPIHASPAEHQATPDVADPHWDPEEEPSFMAWTNYNLSGNLSHGWVQYRQLLSNQWIPG